jgi:hypothetical protein
MARLGISDAPQLSERPEYAPPDPTKGADLPAQSEPLVGRVDEIAPIDRAVEQLPEGGPGFVFFALMGVMYFLTTYLQSVLGFSALEAGVRMIPIAVGMVLASKLSISIVRRRPRRSWARCRARRPGSDRR